MWPWIVICIAVPLGLCVLIRLIPTRFFDATLWTSKIVAPFSPLKTMSLRQAIADQKTFLQQTSKYLDFRFRPFLVRLNAEARLLTPGALDDAGISPEEMKIVIELTGSLIHECNGDSTEAIDRLFEAVKKIVVKLGKISDNTYEVARYLAVAGPLIPFVGPALAFMVAYTSFAIVMRQERESVALHRSLSEIANRMESTTVSKFEIAYETIQGAFQTECAENVSLTISQINMKRAIREWLSHLVTSIDNAPSPTEPRVLKFLPGKRTSDFDKYIAVRLAPLDQHLLIGIATDFMVADALGRIPGFFITLSEHRAYLEDARKALRNRMVSSGIGQERTSLAACIAEWLDERCSYLDSLAEKLRGVPICQTFPKPAELTFGRRVRYLVHIAGIVVRRMRQEHLYSLRVHARLWRRYTIHRIRVRWKAR